MTHEQKIKALIENIGYLNAEDLAGVVYEAHGSINLLAEIAEAAQKLSDCVGDRLTYWGRLDDLLAKYKPKEAQNGE